MLALLSRGCVNPTVPAPVDRDVMKTVASSAAGQVRRCYRSPRIPHAARQIVTRLLVRYSADGAVAGIPILLSQTGITPENRPYAARMAEAATLAVLRCAPVRLPPQLHRSGWDELQLTFSPVALG
jgi:hypothetical protein